MFILVIFWYQSHSMVAEGEMFSLAPNIEVPALQDCYLCLVLCEWFLLKRVMARAILQLVVFGAD